MSLPIPTEHRSRTTYAMLGLGNHVKVTSRGRFTATSLCHEDPMFCGDRCAFGQTGAAQTHLANNRVGVDDVFLFFGLFREDGGKRHHRIFGYLQVEKVIPLGPRPKIEDSPKGFPRLHPHFIGEWNDNNTLYLGSGATATMASDQLCLTRKGSSPSIWQVPIWLREVGMTYHRPESWLADHCVKTAGRGQEFVADIGTLKSPRRWVREIIEAMNG